MARSRLALGTIALLIPITLAGCGGSSVSRTDVINASLEGLTAAGAPEAIVQCMRPALEAFSDDEINALSQDPVPPDVDAKVNEALAQCVAANPG